MVLVVLVVVLAVEANLENTNVVYIFDSVPLSEGMSFPVVHINVAGSLMKVVVVATTALVR